MKQLMHPGSFKPAASPDGSPRRSPTSAQDDKPAKAMSYDMEGLVPENSPRLRKGRGEPGGPSPRSGSPSPRSGSARGDSSRSPRGRSRMHGRFSGGARGADGGEGDWDD